MKSSVEDQTSDDKFINESVDAEKQSSISIDEWLKHLTQSVHLEEDFPQKENIITHCLVNYLEGKPNVFSFTVPSIFYMFGNQET